MKILVTGGRNFNDYDVVCNTLNNLHQQTPFSLLIHGDASGADRLSGRWAKENGIEVLRCPANWKKHGRAAGPIRNREMLEHEPDLLVAFPGGRGTADMKRAAKESGLQITEAQQEN